MIPRPTGRKSEAFQRYRSSLTNTWTTREARRRLGKKTEPSCGSASCPDWATTGSTPSKSGRLKNSIDDIRHELTPATANRHLSLIKRLFNLAIDWGHIDASPARGVKGFKENNQRTAWLTAEEIGRLFAVCAAYPDPYVGALFPFLLMTGARRSEALQARLQNFDLERAMWLIPDAKSGRGRHVPLSPQAVALISNLPRQPDNPYVFCGHVKGQRLVNVAKPWERIKAAAKLPDDFRPHDLRHTFASWGVSTGIDLYQIQTLLGHSTMQMTQRYAHLDEGGIKASVNHISNQMDAAIQETQNSKESEHGV